MSPLLIILLVLILLGGGYGWHSGGYIGGPFLGGGVGLVIVVVLVLLGTGRL